MKVFRRIYLKHNTFYNFKNKKKGKKENKNMETFRIVLFYYWFKKYCKTFVSNISFPQTVANTG